MAATVWRSGRRSGTRAFGTAWTCGRRMSGTPRSTGPSSSSPSRARARSTLPTGGSARDGWTVRDLPTSPWPLEALVGGLVVAQVIGAATTAYVAAAPPLLCHAHVYPDGRVETEHRLEGISPPRPWDVARDVINASTTGLALLVSRSAGMRECAGPPLTVTFWQPPRISGGGSTVGDVFVTWMPTGYEVPSFAAGFGVRAEGQGVLAPEGRYVRYGPNISSTRGNEVELGRHRVLPVLPEPFRTRRQPQRLRLHHRRPTTNRPHCPARLPRSSSFFCWCAAPTDPLVQSYPPGRTGGRHRPPARPLPTAHHRLVPTRACRSGSFASRPIWR